MRRRSQPQQHRASTRSTGGEATSREPETIRIKLLGGFRLWVGSRVVEERQWRLRKARSLIKLLAFSPAHRLHRQQVMELLWPGLEPQAAANNLHQVLHAARCALVRPAPPDSADAPSRIAPASGYLLLRDEQLTLFPDTPVWVDVEAFEEAAAATRQAPLEHEAFRVAISLYAGELLPQDRYEVWVEERRSQLRELYLSLLMDLAALLEEREEFGEAIAALGRVVAEEATHEGAHLELMRLLGSLPIKCWWMEVATHSHADFGSSPDDADILTNGKG
jgi:DNA-binding SARP family transcriptional activator